MSEEDEDRGKYLFYCFIVLIITCLLVAYLLYWIIKRNRNESYSKIRFKRKTNRTIAKTKRRKGEESKRSLKSNILKDRQSKLETRTSIIKIGSSMAADNLKLIKEITELNKPSSKLSRSPKSKLSSQKDQTIEYQPQKRDSKIDQFIDKENVESINRSTLTKKPSLTKIQFLFKEPRSLQEDDDDKSIPPILSQRDIRNDDLKESKLDKTNSGSSSLSVNQNKMDSSFVVYQTTPISNIEGNGRPIVNLKSKFADVNTTAPTVNLKSKILESNAAQSNVNLKAKVVESSNATPSNVTLKPKAVESSATSSVSLKGKVVESSATSSVNLKSKKPFSRSSLSVSQESFALESSLPNASNISKNFSSFYNQLSNFIQDEFSLQRSQISESSKKDSKLKDPKQKSMKD